jgi:RND family efflux transporter MFP subunit
VFVARRPVAPAKGKNMPVSGEDTVIKGGTDTAAAPGALHALAVVMPPLVSAPPPVAVLKRRRWPWAAGAMLAAGLAALVYLQPWATPVPVVTVETMAPAPVARILAVNGRVAGVQSVDVRPVVSGTLVEVLVDEGETVTRNQTLIYLDTEAQQAVVRQALAGLDAALLAQDDAMTTLARTRALGDNAARVVLENAVRAEQSAAQEVARMNALLEQSRIHLDKFTIRAPMDGTVLVLHADPGQSVDPATVLLTLADLGALVVETDVDESYATQVHTGQTAALQLLGETIVRPAHVSFVSQRVDADTGGLAVRLAPDEPLSAPIGLTVTANITVDEQAEAITVPRAAIVRDAAGLSVLVLTGDHAERRAVQVIEWPAARLIVTDGLVPGDVVISDATGLTDGQNVQVAP